MLKPAKSQENWDELSLEQHTVGTVSGHGHGLCAGVAVILTSTII